MKIIQYYSILFIRVLRLAATAASAAFFVAAQLRARPTPTRAGSIQAGLLNRLRGKREVEAPKEVVAGAALPDIDVEYWAAVDWAEGGAADASEDAPPPRPTVLSCVYANSKFLSCVYANSKLERIFSNF